MVIVSDDIPQTYRHKPLAILHSQKPSDSDIHTSIPKRLVASTSYTFRQCVYLTASTAKKQVPNAFEHDCIESSLPHS